MVENWDAVLQGVRRTVEFLEQENIFDARRLPSDVVIPVLVGLWGLAPKVLDSAGQARVTLRKYLWRAFFTARYEKSTNSRSLADFMELKPVVLGDGGQRRSPDIFDDAEYPLPEPQELMKAGWPKGNDRLGRAILALALKKGGCDLADGTAVTRSNLNKREYHHVFPDAHLTRNGVPGNQIYLSLNCALVTWQTNRNISDKEPERYLAERREGTSLGEAEIRARLATHLIPFDEMLADDYPAFLQKRASTVHAEMTKLCESGGT
jgi:hypothetical protein